MFVYLSSSAFDHYVYDVLNKHSSHANMRAYAFPLVQLGHIVTPFMANHLPTYAACNCKKTATCQLKRPARSRSPTPPPQPHPVSPIPIAVTPARAPTPPLLAPVLRAAYTVTFHPGHVLYRVPGDATANPWRCTYGRCSDALHEGRLDRWWRHPFPSPLSSNFRIICDCNDMPAGFGDE